MATTQLRTDALDGTRLYMNTAAQAGLLSPEQEHTLALELANTEPHTRNHIAAFNTLTEKNLLLVINIAKRYVRPGLDLDDLISEGNIGLLKAVEKFDPYRVGPEGRPIRFSTYATWWIRQEIAKSIPEQHRTIRLPSHIADTLRKIERAGEHLREQLGREPTPEEIASALGIPLTDVLDLSLHLTPVASLDRPLESSEETLTLADQVAAPEPVEDNVSSLELHRLFREAGLHPRERQILKLRFGLRDGRERTLEEVGHEFGLTRERVRQIEKLAITKLSRVSPETLVALGLEDYAKSPAKAKNRKAAA